MERSFMKADKLRPIPMQRTTLFILIFIVALLIWEQK